MIDPIERGFRRSDTGAASTVAELPTVLPERLRQGLRDALDGGRGRLRMDPQDLAELIGRAIDLEVERIGRVCRERERRLRLRRMLAAPQTYFGMRGQKGINAAGEP